MTPRFADRQDAGRQLARRLEEYRDRDDLVVLGLVRGGIPVAAEIARALEAPLDVLVVRKLDAPGREELVMGALAPEGIEVLNDDVVAALGVSDDMIAEVEHREADLLERRLTRFRGGRPPLQLFDRTILIVDDGLATGASMRAAIQFVRSKEPEGLVVAAPTGSTHTCASMAGEVDDLICPYRPFPFFGVSQAYREFPKIDDETVQRALQETPM